MKYNYNILIFIFIIIIIVIILFNSYTKKYTIAGFQNGSTPWSPNLIKRFNIYQSTVNTNVNQFNLEQLQKQATPAEAEEYLKTGYWPWPDDLKNLYIEQVWKNPIIKIDPQYALDYAMKVYNQNAVRELLAWNTKEGHFLLYGGDLGFQEDGLPTNFHNTIKCSPDSLNMEKKVYTGMNLWNGYMNSITTSVKPEDIPKEMPGFSFVKGPCNPCVALNFSDNRALDFTCPFRITSQSGLPSGQVDDSISEPWKQLWKL